MPMVARSLLHAQAQPSGPSLVHLSCAFSSPDERAGNSSGGCNDHQLPCGGTRVMRANGALVAAMGTLIVATSVIQLANGFFTTLISLRVALEGFAPSMGGLVLSSYFAGFTLGAVRSDRIITRIGHIAQIRGHRRRRDRRHAAARRPLALADPACADRLRLCRVVRRDRELAQRQVAARHAGPCLCGLYGRHLHGPRRWAIADRPDRRHGGRPLQRDRGPVRPGLGARRGTRAEPPRPLQPRRRPIGSSCGRRRSPSCAAL